jgi:hypothetical protein
MDAKTVKAGWKRLLDVLPLMLPAAGWYFVTQPPADAHLPEQAQWTCMFTYVARLAAGDQICFSAGRNGCVGAACYLGFAVPSGKAGRALAEKERFKKDANLGNAFYEQLSAPSPRAEHVVWGAIAHIPDDRSIEVVNLWLDADGLAGMLTLANYDRPGNDHVIIPFASGCQSIWTIPYAEQTRMEPRCVVGGLDPAMRSHLPSGILSLAMPASRFVVMTANITGSFLEGNRWQAMMDAKR